MFLTSQKAKEWREGKWKHTYTNFYPKKKVLSCLSGDYVYIIELIGQSQLIPFNKVPKGYQNCLNKDKKVYKTKAKLVRVDERKLRKNENRKT